MGLRSAGSVVGAFAFATLVACGLSVTATGDADNADGAAPSTSSPTMPASGPAADGGEQPSDCDGGTTCNGICTDPASDPLNCGRCGNACQSGESCNGGVCGVLCINDKQKCGAACVDLQTDPSHCGTCGKTCVTPDVCSKGSCQADCDPSLTACAPKTAGQPGYCANLITDPDNCGTCGKACSATEVCSNGACTSLCATGVMAGDTYGAPAAPTMVGCVGTKSWKDRAVLCAPAMKPCTPEQWVSRHGATPPSYNYWTDANLGWYGTSAHCAAVESGGFSCDSRSSQGNPMRVCASAQDPAGNHCRWTGCGLNSQSNQYFGGCQDNPTAGTLCCVP